MCRISPNISEYILLGKQNPKQLESQSKGYVHEKKIRNHYLETLSYRAVFNLGRILAMSSYASTLAMMCYLLTDYPFRKMEAY